jgi:hypothetical protein
MKPIALQLCSSDAGMLVPAATIFFGLAVLQDASIEQPAGSKKKDQVSRASESHTYRRMISAMESNGRL